MLKLQVASKDTSISQLQVALFAGREEQSDLSYKLRKLEEAAQAMDGSAAPSRRASFGLKTLNPEEEGRPPVARRLDPSFDGFAEGAGSAVDCGLEAGSETHGRKGEVLLTREQFEEKSNSANHFPASSATDWKLDSKHRANTPGPETLPPAGVFSPVGRNRAQQLAGDDMRRSLTMDRGDSWGLTSGIRRNEQSPSAHEQSSAAIGRLTAAHGKAQSGNWNEAPQNERSPPRNERNNGRADEPESLRSLSGSGVRSLEKRHVAEFAESCRGEPPVARRESPDPHSTQLHNRPNSPQERATPPRTEFLTSGTDRPIAPVASPGAGSVSSQLSLGTPGTFPRGNENVPFATKQSLRETMDETAAIESKLMEVSLKRSQVRSCEGA